MYERQEHPEIQQIPLKVYRTGKRLMVAAPMPGLAPADISVEVTNSGHLILRGALRGVLKDAKQVLIDEWSAGGYYRDLPLPLGVDGELANLTYDNGVLVAVLPISDQVRPARLTLEPIGHARGERVGSQGQAIESTTTEQHQAAKAAEYADDATRTAHGGHSDPPGDRSES